MLLLSIIQVLPIEQPMVGTVSAGSSWVATTPDFVNGSNNNTMLTPEGNVTLVTQSWNVIDPFDTEINISSKENVFLDTSSNSIKINKIQNINGHVDDDRGESIKQTSDGGYIVAGYNQTPLVGYDGRIIKMDQNLNEEWNRTYGGSSLDKFYSINQTSDGGYIIAGITYSFDVGGGDAWLMKTNDMGNISWSKIFGSTAMDIFKSVYQTSDGGYIMAGNTQSYTVGLEDVWLLKTDSSGNELWNKTFGGISNDLGTCVMQTSDGGFIIAGTNIVSGLGSQAWLIKTDSSGNELWNYTYGGPGYDYGQCVIETSAGNFVVAGHLNSWGQTNTV